MVTVVPDDPTILNDETLLRWVPSRNPALMKWDSVTGELIGPSSAAFSPDTDGVSVFLDSVLRDADLDAQSIVHGPTDSVWSLSVADIRGLEFNLGVRRDAWPVDVDDVDHPRYGAHALITGLIGVSKKTRIKAQKALANAASLKCVYVPDL